MRCVSAPLPCAHTQLTPRAADRTCRMLQALQAQSFSCCCSNATIVGSRVGLVRSSMRRGLPSVRSLSPSRESDPTAQQRARHDQGRRARVSTSASTDMLTPRHLASSSRREPIDATPSQFGSKQQAPVGASSSGNSSDPEEGGGPRSPFSWKLLVGMTALSVVICYADRSNISTAILPMSATYGWDKAFQGIVLSSFFLGYALTQMLGGQLADRYGGKQVLTAGVAVWSLFTAVIPVAAAAGTGPLLATRVMLGIGEGVAFPAIHSLIARNVPYANQSASVGIVTAASYAGTALAFGLSPMIITNLGWPYVFYIFAAFALLWLPLWLPVKVLPQQDVGSPPAEQTSSKVKAGPPLLDRGFWGLLRRKEVLAICIAQYTGSWGMYGLLNWLPTFFSDFYHVELADLATYTLLPYVVQGGLGAASGFVADHLISSGWSVKQVRTGLQVLGMIGPAACLLLAVSPVVGGSPVVASSLITVGLGFSALTLGGVSTSHLDIAPKHAGAIFGAGNTAACLAGFISVPATGYLLQTFNSWPLVFGITALHYVVGAVVWGLWVGDKPLPEDDWIELESSPKSEKGL